MIKVDWTALMKRERAASALSYGLVVGLVAVLSIGAVQSVGDSVTELFGGVAEDLGRTGESTPLPSNQAPVAVDNSGAAFTTDEDTAFTTDDVLANDSDADAGDVLSVTSVDTSATRGLVTNNGDGTFGYDPNGQFESLNTGDTDTDSLSYTISDGTDTATATVTITIAGVDEPDPCDATLTSADYGLECADGAFYAGEVGGNDIFIAPVDEGDTSSGAYEVPNGLLDENNKFFAWNNDQDQDTTADSPTDGLANTQALVGDSDGNSGRHPAAEVCDDKTLGGADWYLPARNELQAVWDNLVNTDNSDSLNGSEQSAAETAYDFDFIGQSGAGRYWSSSESTINGAWFVRFDNGNEGGNNKDFGLSVRCVRR